MATVVVSARGGGGGIPLPLPLLEGLSHRPGAADAIVEEAFQRFEAGRRIAQWMLQRHRKMTQKEITTVAVTAVPIETAAGSRKRRKVEAIGATSGNQGDIPADERNNTKNNRVSSYSVPTVPSCHHWLIQGLHSSSRLERQVACRILSQGCRLDEHRLWRLVELLVTLLDSNVLKAEGDNDGKDGAVVIVPPDISTIGLAWMALLKHVVLVVPSTPASPSHAQFVLAYSLNRRYGLPWLCNTIWNLVLQLQHPYRQHGSPDSSSQTSAGLPRQQHQSLTIGVTTNLGRVKAVQHFLFSAVELLYWLVLYGVGVGGPEGDVQDKAHVLKTSHQYLWGASLMQHQQKPQKPSQKHPPTLSPLACLIGSYHMLKQQTDPFFVKTKSMDACLVCLGRLVDPSCLPKVVQREEDGTKTQANTTSNTTGERNQPRDRLLSTFASSSSSIPSSSSLARSSTTTDAIRTSLNTLVASTKNSQRSSNRGAGITTSITSGPSDRSAAAAVARIFSAVYGGGEQKDDGDDDDDDEDDEDDDDVVMEDVEHHDDNDEDDDDDEHDEDDDDDEHDNDEQEDEGQNESSQPNTTSMSATTVTNSTATTNVQQSNDDHHDDDDDDEDDDEEIDSDVVEEDDDCGGDDVGDDDDDEEEHDIVIHDDDVARLEEGLLELNQETHVVDLDDTHNISSSSSSTSPVAAVTSPATASSNAAASGNSALQHSKTVQERKRAYICASMEVLMVQHPQFRSRLKPLSLVAEQSLMMSILNIIKPPKKPLNAKIILRRAPTQEEFFRGSLSKNPVSLNMLQSSAARARQQGGEQRRPQLGEEANEPTVGDLRQHIANDLQMSDSAELLELLVANKILDINLKLRVVHQVLWKSHLMENSSTSALSSFLSASSSRGGGAPSFFSTGSGLSMIFSSGLAERSRNGSSGPGSRNVTAGTPLSALPPMVVTYRLTGVDGEATEDTVNTLADPEAPSDAASPEEVEQMMEKEYGITRLVMTKGRGVFVLLRSVETHIIDTLRRIRRDDAGGARTSRSHNPSRASFKESRPYPGLTLLWYASKLPSNRKLLLESRAPTILLRLLLDVLHALEEGKSQVESQSNATAKVLQELIEVLASDISTVSTTENTSSETGHSETDGDAEQDASTLRLLLSSIESTSLSRPLRNVIAKLLPYLTYGQVSLSRELASDFARHVAVDHLRDNIEEASILAASMSSSRRPVLMDTFVHASISLPPNEVCNSLRSELINCGFIERMANFLLRDFPSAPPPWSASLWLKDQQVTEKERESLEAQWRDYFRRPGLRTAFNMLIGLTKKHAPTQLYLATFTKLASGGWSHSFLRACHWMEATSDNSNSNTTGAPISMNGLGLVAETLLDELAETNPTVEKQVNAVRRKTRDRKKEIALARRSKALVSMSSFGPLAGAATLETAAKGLGEGITNPDGGNGGSVVRDTAASLLAPVWGLFRDASATGPSGSSAGQSFPAPTSPSAKRKKTKPVCKLSSSAKPDWMAEMESMEDETGLTCAVCQEGRTLQPSELLGLYAYVKKVSVPVNQCGGRTNIDGTALLTLLPTSFPETLLDTHAALEWFPAGKAAGDELRESSRASSTMSVASSRRATYFTTTVSAGNAIHFSCHTKARKADRSHPKAPKSEWEGASLRNSRVKCNVIMPLVSSRSSKVPLVAVDVALTDHQTAVSNLLGARPKSMLWTVLHDVRFLLLRIAYGEPLNSDCGGGSLASNAQMVFYQLLMADMFEKDAQVDAPETAQHARGLSAGFLAACAIISAKDKDDVDGVATSSTSLLRSIADSAPMAALTCVLFHNNRDDFSSPDAEASEEDQRPHSKRRWLYGKESFLRGLLKCAGRRHALGVETSGCVSGRSSSSSSGSGSKSNSNSSNRSTAFADWDIVEDDDVDSSSTPSSPSGKRKSSINKRNVLSKPGIDDFRDALRPFIVYYAIMEQLSSEFVLNMDDKKVEESANRLVAVIEGCRRATSIRELLAKARVEMDHDAIIAELQRGMIAA